VFLQLAEETTLNLNLSAPSGATELAGVTVTAAAPGATFQADNKGLSSNISQRELKVIPNPNRSIQDIARTDPHIVLTNVGRGEISALGQNSRYNNITIDAVPTNDSFGLEANGLPALNQPLSFDAIEEVGRRERQYRHQVRHERFPRRRLLRVHECERPDERPADRLQGLRREEDLRRDARRTDHQGQAVLLPLLRGIEDARAGSGVRPDWLGCVEHRQHQPGRHQPHHQRRRQLRPDSGHARCVRCESGQQALSRQARLEHHRRPPRFIPL
jgi:hypothetical protein